VKGSKFNAPLDNAPPVANIQSCLLGLSLPFFRACAIAIGPITCKDSTANGPASPTRGLPVTAVRPIAENKEAAMLAPCSIIALSNLPQL